jgi:hypothetical protein
MLPACSESSDKPKKKKYLQKARMNKADYLLDVHFGPEDRGIILLLDLYRITLRYIPESGAPKLSYLFSWF